MSRHRWLWVTLPEGGWALAFTYVDPMAGASARGARVESPPTRESIRRAVERPNLVFREPAKFHPIVLSAEEVKRFALPDAPPWLDLFERSPTLSTRGTPTREVAGRVVFDGNPVPGALVQIGWVTPPRHPEFVPTDGCTTGPDGSFTLSVRRGDSLVASLESLRSLVCPLPADPRVPIDLEMLRLGRVEGEVHRDGSPARAAVSLLCDDATRVTRSARTDALGHYAIDGVLPGCYEVHAEAVDEDHKINGARAIARIELGEGETIRHAVSVAVGVRLEVVVTLDDDGDAWATIALIPRSVTPRTLSELRSYLADPTVRVANSLSRLGRSVETHFCDVTPGVWTLCAVRTGAGDRPVPDTPTVCRRIVVADTPQRVALQLPVR